MYSQICTTPVMHAVLTMLFKEAKSPFDSVPIIDPKRAFSEKDMQSVKGIVNVILEEMKNNFCRWSGKNLERL